ncbi:MCP four helix bundle domain-containing protein [Algibacter pacificus]|uniref:MCP four helix bundle domain-containing protein n=1 Tax=Algibacter pacificus TaxID=2599389 RepID=UPI0011C93FC3|nr:MCP four helix bundle domain-containing protein [Algibacter pacificus]
MAFYNKIKWVLGILMVFVLILATNLIDRNNFLRVKDAVITIYEDRLVANDLIFEMSIAIQEKEIAIAKLDSIFFLERNKQVNHDIEGLISRFEKTKLTTEEGNIFNDLKDNLKTLQLSETAFVQSKFTKNTAFTNPIKNVKDNLSKLSKIQLSEGERQTLMSKKAIDSVELFTQMEIYILVFLAILIQIIVIYKPKEKN